MEQQNTQPIKENTGTKPPSKTNWKFIAIVVVLGLIFVGEAVWISTKIENSVTFIPPLAIPWETYQQCTQTSNCVLVQTGWCKSVLAVNKKYETEWRDKDKVNTKIARQRRQTCKPTTSEREDINNFIPACNKSQCEAIFTRDDHADISTWQTYRNDEFGFEVRYPGDWTIVKYREGWRIEPGRLAVEISQAPYESIFIDNVLIKIGQDMLDVVIANTGIDCPGCHASRNEISTRNFGDNSFYYVFHSLSEGQYGVVYYLRDPDGNSAIRFWLTGFTKSEKNWTDPDYNVDNEPNHSILKQILSTFRFTP